jgi:hydroxymethylbilane synthase
VTGPVRLATRGSPLALAQARSVADLLEAVGVDASIVVVETEGDRRRDVDLLALAGRGVFAKEVQAAVLDGRADVAVHSAKDLPAEAPLGLVLVSVPERRDPADVLVGRSLGALSEGAIVATGAPRRRALLLAARPDLTIVGLRGNIDTRLASVGRDGIEAVVVAAAALDRLGLADAAAERLDPEIFVPQVGQGAIALECLDGGAFVELLEGVDDKAAHAAVRCERSFLAELGVGCDLPGGAWAQFDGKTATIRGVLATDDGTAMVRGSDSDPAPELAGRALAARLRREIANVGGSA